MNDLSEIISNGDFSSFDSLPESQQSQIAKGWDKEMRLKYLSRHEIMTEEEFFSKLDKLVVDSNYE